MGERPLFVMPAGSLITVSDEPAEYKQVTVLFANVVAVDGYRLHDWLRSGCAKS
jgi:hypothetical protein